jgi:tetratricopeptide repeat protein 30
MVKTIFAKMPPRREQDLDPLTLHNQALASFDEDFEGACRKLKFLLQNPPCPPQTFGNLLLLYCKFSLTHLAGNLWAEYLSLNSTSLSHELHYFLNAVILSRDAKDEALHKLDGIAKVYKKTLRTLQTKLQNSQAFVNVSEATRNHGKDYEAELEKYIPILMAQTCIYWKRSEYMMAERNLQESSEFCHNHPVWKLNMAHVLFMKEEYDKALGYYEPIVKQAESLLKVPAIALANLCVVYILTERNDKAEKLMRRIEEEEYRVTKENPEFFCFHTCILDLVIGTLYCNKGNYEFGISRIVKSFEPYNRKLGTDTWFYAKRCLLSLAEKLAKHMLTIPDATFHSIVKFMKAAERCGKDIPTLVENNHQGLCDDMSTIAYEARCLKEIFIAFMS